ncbi:hypothetical protein M1L60_21230 [Actinoplanes sp. TRM 88003]|uniref:Uncharacterized protein n=1 Tax=Paractinoplanes aksuensis TaxID=2939490 RepID=A0ABT1DQJ0_9ACTN|nr:hypothetical protein [Actinoplanes aksuensis]MCO8273119.1 hypothetical protein [Actinoplanes aksuensis]
MTSAASRFASASYPARSPRARQASSRQVRPHSSASGCPLGPASSQLHRASAKTSSRSSTGSIVSCRACTAATSASGRPEA